jgi:glyoxylate reductase
MALSKPRILFFNPVRHALEAYQKLSLETRTEVIASKSRAEFFQDVKDRYKDVVAIYSTSSSYSVTICLYR